MKQKGASHRIGIDLLGSDLAPQELLKTILGFAEDLPENTHLVLFGTSALFNSVTPPNLNLVFHPAEQEITMEEAPLVAIRQKRDSSLCTGVRLLKEGQLQAFISAGNTGALIACSKIEIPALPSIERPALITLLPTKAGDMAVLDVGATTSCQANHLIQFAMMGVAYQKSRGISTPRVGLLNIGAEAKKGTPELQQAYHRLQMMSETTSSFSFIGNIEGREAFYGHVDVLVTDGFTGNVFLKTAEGIASLILEELPSHAKNSFAHLRYTEYPGALLAGIDGIVIKCHGSASAQSLTRSITTASRLIEHQFLSQIKKELDSIA